ncbi:ABC transporter permease [Actinomadura sp. NBRC 104412]|uniref:ABC transporter permease n=1 Tax=Actinomadura sp. NBRC 104412 TaxID=3032203 RepID=UPI0024A0150D|nr:ABC transporter permease [Actinomadura sp. NBRC 104412]GLZ06843.1 ABC transporter permease [Actinomadura sp. NBRC 104412]
MNARYGIFAALAFAAALIGSCGVLLESATRAHAPVARYAEAAAVVTGPGTVSAKVRSPGSEPELRRRPVTERPRVPVAAAGRLRRVPGVRDVVADVSFPAALADGTTYTGHGWSRLAVLRAGRAPQAPGEVAVDAAAGLRPGQRTTLQVNGAPQPFVVSGIVAAGLYVAPGTAAALSGHPSRADALVVFGDPDVARLRAAVPGLRVATGDARGDAENPAVAAARPDIGDMASSLGAASVMVALIVVGGLIALSIRERGHEYALLRAIGATPRQVRREIIRENARTAVAAGLPGGILSLPLGATAHAAMRRNGVLPDGFGLGLSPLPALAACGIVIAIAVVSARVASMRLTRIHPVQALGEAAAERRRTPRWRTVTGLVFLALGLGSLGLSAAASGPEAALGVGGLVISQMAATALLAPVIARAGARVLGGAARRVDPVSGGLAAHAAGAAALRAGAVLTPAALAVAYAGVQVFVHTTMVRAAEVQAEDAMLARHVIVSDGAGVPAETARTVRAVPGVTAATAVKDTTVVMVVRELGEEELRSVPARGVSPEGLERTLDPKVVAGRLGDLRGDTVALSRNVAGGAEVGAVRPMWLADGTPIRPRVAAIYERGAGVGDVLLHRDLVAAHATSPLDDQVLVAGGAGVERVAAGYTGTRTIPAGRARAERSRELRAQGFVTRVAAAAISGFAVIGLVTTQALATASRRREFELLRLTGATRRQVLRSLRLETAIVLGTGVATGVLVAGVALVMFAGAVGLPLPSAPPVPLVLILALVAGPGAAATMLPARAVLRRRTAEPGVRSPARGARR